MKGLTDKPGYTLIEVLVALSIVAILLGVSIPVAYSWQELAKLRTPAQKLYDLVNQARSDSFNESRIYTLRLRKDQFEVYPHGESEPVDSYSIPEGTSYLFKPWLATDWQTPEFYEWVISPFELLEPLSFRFQRKDQYVEQTYHPLTANIADKTLFVP